MGELFDALLTALREHGWAELIARAIPVLDQPQRETVLALAAHLVRADRQVQPVEEQFLEELSNRLELPPGRAQQILDVVSLLHRDALA
jgi:tellurite resistance protein